MSWQDRDYYERPSGALGRSIWSFLMGAVPLGTWFGIRVRVHATLVIFILLSLLFPPGHRGPGFDWWWAFKTSALSMGILFAVVLLHEFGHCVAALRMGGEADEILLWPLGGLAYTNPPQRPWPTFVTVLGGPLVNVLICGLAGLAIYILDGASLRHVPLNPFAPRLAWAGPAYYLGLVFFVSYLLLLFNLLPIYPLDGGQMLQAILWPKIGYYRSMYLSCITGMVGAGVLAGVGFVTWDFLLVFIALAGFMTCYQRRTMLRELGPEGFLGALDYSASMRAERRHHRHLSKRVIRRARRRAAKEQAEQTHIDAILAKVSAHGMHSLNWRERRTLRRATARQRERDMEVTRFRG